MLCACGLPVSPIRPRVSVTRFQTRLAALAWDSDPRLRVTTASSRPCLQVAEQQGRWLAETLSDAAALAASKSLTGARHRDAATTASSCTHLSLPRPPTTSPRVASPRRHYTSCRLPYPLLTTTSGEERLTAITSFVPKRPFVYKHRGAMVVLGTFEGIVDFTKGSPLTPLYGQKIRGIIAWLIWRSAYFTKLGSIKNRLQVPWEWTKTLLFGRDLTAF